MRSLAHKTKMHLDSVNELEYVMSFLRVARLPNVHPDVWAPLSPVPVALREYLYREEREAKQNRANNDVLSSSQRFRSVSSGSLASLEGATSIREGGSIRLSRPSSALGTESVEKSGEGSAAGRKESLQVMLLESIYLYLLGPDFTYRLGRYGVHQDLFLWSLLLNRRDMAECFWQWVDRPVRSALLAAHLLRSMAADYNPEDQSAALQMLDNADHFEELAILVHTAAIGDKSVVESVAEAPRRSDAHRALAALDCPLEMFTGLALLDLVIQSKSIRFFERCCEEALWGRLFGDIDHRHSLSTSARVVVGVLSLGLLPALVPGFLHWAQPPMSKSVRGFMQRRSTPVGYPLHPERNHVMHGLRELLRLRRARGRDQVRKAGGWWQFAWFRIILATKTKKEEECLMKLCSKPGHELKKCSDAELALLWEATFTPHQRLDCFFSAPIALFVANAAQTMAVTGAFTLFFIATVSAAAPSPASTSPSPSTFASSTWPTTPGPSPEPTPAAMHTPAPLSDRRPAATELILAIYFGCALWREITQVWDARVV